MTQSAVRYAKVCPCGQAFQAKRRDTIYCAPACAKRYAQRAFARRGRGLSARKTKCIGISARNTFAWYAEHCESAADRQYAEMCAREARQ